jgi:hypothetical protein
MLCFPGSQFGTFALAVPERKHDYRMSPGEELAEPAGRAI